MKNTLKLVWQFKWIVLLTLLIEWLILLPVFFLMDKFGSSTLAINLEVTPIGSSEFLAIFIGAMLDNSTLLNSFIAFAVLLPILFISKLALSAGATASMQQKQRKISLWFSNAGKYLLPSLGLFLRWIIIPIILCAVCVLLNKVADVGSKKPLMVVLALVWFICFSWFYLALNIIVQGEKHALKKGWKMLKENIGQVLVNVVVFMAGAVCIQLSSWYVFKNNGEVTTGLLMAVLCALILAIATRTLVLFWQASYVQIWSKTHNYRAS